MGQIPNFAIVTSRGHDPEPWSLDCRTCGMTGGEIMRAAQQTCLGGEATIPDRDINPPLRRTRVYVAGPITSSGNLLLNVRHALHVGTTLLKRGYAPYVPHLTCFWEIAAPEAFTYEDWMTLDMEYLATCDVLLRLPGESKGADREVELAQSLGMPVYYTVDRLCACELDRRSISSR